MTAQLQSLLVALDVVLVFTATILAVGVWHGQRASFPSRRTHSEPNMAIVGSSSNVPAHAGDMPSDPSLPEAA
jgi:hypothetical protein